MEGGKEGGKERGRKGEKEGDVGLLTTTAQDWPLGDCAHLLPIVPQTGKTSL